MAHKKAGGTTSNLRTSNPKYLGVKLFGGQFANVGNIILRQRGNKFRPGANVGQGKDFTLFALKEGFIKFVEKRIKSYDGSKKRVKFVSVEKEGQDVK